MAKGARVVHVANEIISGASYCFRGPEAARRASARVTVSPGVTVLERGGESLYLANGDFWIDDAGRVGQHHYGRRGRYVDLIRGDFEGE